MRISCEGAPRDLGLDQGRAIGEGVDAELSRILRSHAFDTATSELGRDVERYFPHLAERMAGLASGASVERRALVMALARASCDPSFLFRPARAVAVRSPGPVYGLAARFDLAADRCSTPIVRSSRPNGGFESLELTLPWLAASLGGVNEHGLAALLGPPGAALLPGAGREADSPCRAPAFLFVQQCLERFDRVETAVDWCLTRPAHGSGSVLLADAHGAAALVELDAERRHVRTPGENGRLDTAEGAAPGADATLVVSSLPALLDGPRVEGDPLRHRAFLHVDPGARRIALVADREGLAPAGVVEEHVLLGA